MMNNPIYKQKARVETSNKQPLNKQISLRKLMQNYQECPSKGYVLNFCFSKQLPSQPLFREAQSQYTQYYANSINCYSQSQQNLSVSSAIDQPVWQSTNNLPDFSNVDKQNIALNDINQFKVESKIFKSPKMEPEKAEKTIIKPQKKTNQLLEMINKVEKKLNNDIEQLGNRIRRAKEELANYDQDKNQESKKKNKEFSKENGISFSFAIEEGEQVSYLPSQSNQAIMLKNVDEIISEPYYSTQNNQEAFENQPPNYVLHEPIRNVDSLVIKGESDVQRFLNKQNGWFRNYLVQ